MGGPDQTVTVAITRTVRAGCEASFEAALHDFVAKSLCTRGQLGVHVLRPFTGSGSRKYGLLRRFDSTAALDAFYGSALFREWEQTVEPLTEGTRRIESVSGLEAWFTAPGQAIVPPPRWKMAAVTLLAVYPLSLLIPSLLRPLIGHWPGYAASLPIAATMVVALTWLVMPLLARMFHRWLHPGPETP